MSVLSRGIYHNKRSHSLCSSYMAANMRTVWGGHGMCGPQRRQGGHVLLVTGSDVYCNGKKKTKQLLFVTAISGTSLSCEASVSTQARRESRGKCKKEEWSVLALIFGQKLDWKRLPTQAGTALIIPDLSLTFLFCLTGKSINEAQFCFITS